MTSTLNDSEERGNGRWLIATFGSIVLIVVVNLAFQWSMDVFGVLRDPHGRSLITSHHEPKAKFLLSKAYVPANFDGLIVGASASVNWDSNLLTGYRFYNESIEGGGSSGERALVEQALPKGHFKVALICMYPFMTLGHGLFDGLDKTRPEEAYGSLNAFTIEATVLENRFLHRTPEAYPDGSHRLPEHTLEPIPPDMKELEISQDPVGVADYQALIQELMAGGTRIVYFVYPLYQPYYERNADRLAAYLEVAKKEYPSAPIVNFDDPQYLAFRSDPKNWIDEIHLSATGAKALSSMLNIQLHKALQDR